MYTYCTNLNKSDATFISELDYSGALITYKIKNNLGVFISLVRNIDIIYIIRVASL